MCLEFKAHKLTKFRTEKKKHWKLQLKGRVNKY